MKWIAVAFALAGCHREPAPPADYVEDITNLCDVVHLAKADELPRGDRAPIIAMWLGPHIKSSEGHDFLVKIQPLTGDAKANALEAEARKVGLSGCALAAEWREPQ
jgi:PBP1b-binding outer membrane lipoprotein LpoB